MQIPVAGGTGQKHFSRVVECSGTQAALDNATALVATGGRTIIAGYHQGGQRTIDMPAWKWKGIAVAYADEREPVCYIEGMHLALRAIASRKIGPWAVLIHEAGMKKVDEGLRLLRSRPVGCTKAVLWL